MATKPAPKLEKKSPAAKFTPQPAIGAVDYVSISDLSPAEFATVLSLAEVVKFRPADFQQALAGKQIVLIFEKPSLRTRVTFQAGMASLGGVAHFLDSREEHVDAREPLCDIARNLERWVDGIVLRTFAHSTITEMARWAGIPVINALSDHEHPCQALADFITLKERFGAVNRVKLAYVGDGNNVAHSLLLAAALAGSTITLATPADYKPNPKVIADARALAQYTGAKIELTTDPVAAVTGANAVYTDVWASMGQEDEAEARRTIFAPYQVNEALMSHAARNAIFMHCLPAHRGDEVTEAVIESKGSVVFDQAENRLHAQKAILILLLGSGRSHLPARPEPRSSHA
jgi:ornithine carbamoyltransferase